MNPLYNVKEIIFLTTELTISVTLLNQNRLFSLLLCRFLGAFMPQWFIDMRKCPTISPNARYRCPYLDIYFFERF